MFQILDYNREQAVAYAKRWARGRNPAYLNFDKIGGDCTNFISQCLYAGCGVMNPTKVFGWYYYTASDRTAAWTGVEYLHQFLVNNKESGPFAREIPLEKIQPGDIIQLGNHNRFYHSLFVIQAGQPAQPHNVLVATHTFDTLNRTLSSYTFHKLRVLHIQGCRKWIEK